MVRIGTSGWTYPHWRQVLYQGVPSGRWLERYAERFDTVELNGSFYRWPSEARFSAWAGRVPGGFLISVKAPRGLSHGKRLADPAVWLERIEGTGPKPSALDETLFDDFAGLRAAREAEDERILRVLASTPAERFASASIQSRPGPSFVRTQ